ncbi:MAG: GAP family protein [Chloroflexota bacterium]|nr:GAP family protein [Chloroflexota bacterium]
MDVSLLVALIGIAVVDSLNPSLFIAQFYILTTVRPVVRVIAYIAGVLVVNFVGGVLIVSGARAVIGTFFSDLGITAQYGLQLAVGLLLIAFGVWMRVNRMQIGAGRQLKSMKLGAAFGFGMLVMVNELTTALPYFVAIERIAAANLPPALNIVALAVYNLVFALPLFGFLLAFLAVRDRFATWITRANDWIARWMPRLIKYGSLAFGALLSVNAGAYLVAGVTLL